MPKKPQAAAKSVLLDSHFKKVRHQSPLPNLPPHCFGCSISGFSSKARKQGDEFPHEILDTTPELVESTEADTAGTSSDAIEAGGSDGSVPTQDAQEGGGEHRAGSPTGRD
jgi:hypothetical protein